MPSGQSSGFRVFLKFATRTEASLWPESQAQHLSLLVPEHDAVPGCSSLVAVGPVTPPSPALAPLTRVVAAPSPVLGARTSPRKALPRSHGEGLVFKFFYR